jgi:hypothetical protein
MQCITVKQPWATLLVGGATQYLVRDWRTHHRGPLAIQAGRKLSRANVELCCDPIMRGFLRPEGFDFAMELPIQMILGKVTVADCIFVTEENQNLFDPEDPAVHFGIIQPGSWAWICTGSERFAHPVPMPGRLGIFAVPDVLLANA